MSVNESIQAIIIMKKIKRSTVEMWLLTNQDIMSGAGIDIVVGFPKGTIQKFLKYNRRLNDKRINELYDLLKKRKLIDTARKSILK